MKRILTINPGSTSTKIAIFENDHQIFVETLRHNPEHIATFPNIISQYDFRKEVILNAIADSGTKIEELSCVVGRGGLLKPIEGGTYEVNEQMINDLTHAQLEHASNLGGIIAAEIAKLAGCKAYIVDPVVVDELEEVARVSGHKAFERKSIFHALNQKAVAKRYAKENNKNYNELNLIVVHLGGGISVGAHKNGRVIDVNNALDGEGPFSPERSGTLPVGDVYKMAFSGTKTLAEMKKMNVGQGGMMSYLGTSDVREVGKMMAEGNQEAKLIYEAMAYQVGKAVGECACVLHGNVDSIIITGGIAYDKNFVELVSQMVRFITNVTVYPGEDEMLALCEGGLRVLEGKESAKHYA